MFIQCVLVASFVLNRAMQVAVRMPSKGTYVTLWMHEHFAVYKNKSKPKGKRELDIYQAMEFRTGGDMPVDCRVGLSEKELAQIWVKGIYYAPAARIRRARQDLRRDRYIFQKDTALAWIGNQQSSTELRWGIVRSWLWSPIALCGIQCLMCCTCCRELCIRLMYKRIECTSMGGTGITFAA